MSQRVEHPVDFFQSFNRVCDAGRAQFQTNRQIFEKFGSFYACAIPVGVFVFLTELELLAFPSGQFHFFLFDFFLNATQIFVNSTKECPV